jgi:hypothetical protein
MGLSVLPARISLRETVVSSSPPPPPRLSRLRPLTTERREAATDSVRERGAFVVEVERINELRRVTSVGSCPSGHVLEAEGEYGGGRVVIPPAGEKVGNQKDGADTVVVVVGL